MLRCSVQYKKIFEENRGFSDKYWVRDTENSIDKLVKFNNDFYPNQDVKEKIASMFLKIIGIKTVEVELVCIDGKNGCAIESFLSKNEVLYDINGVKKSIFNENIFMMISSDLSKINNVFSNLYQIDEESKEEMKNNLLKIILGDCIIDNVDRKPKNIGIVYNEETKKYRLAPAFDNGLSFHSLNQIDCEPVVYIGNNEYETKDVIHFLIKYHFDKISDIVLKIDDLLLVCDSILNQFIDLDEEFKNKIKNHLNNIKIYIDYIIERELKEEKKY